MADEDACAAAFEHGINRIFEKCSEGDIGDSGKEFAKRMVGATGLEPDEDCEAALEEGLDEATCSDSLGTRQWVFCRIWNAPSDDEDSLLNLNDGDFEAAVEQAWEMVDSECQ